MTGVIDDGLDVDFKAEMTSWLEYRDQHVLEQLRNEGCAFAALPGVVPGNGDFTDFLPHACPHLVVCAPALVVEDVERIYDNLSNRQFGDGMKIKVETAFTPSTGAWFRGAVKFVYTAQVVANPLYAENHRSRKWGHCARIVVDRHGEESALLVVHIGYQREMAMLRFLIPNAIQPRTVVV